MAWAKSILGQRRDKGGAGESDLPGDQQRPSQAIHLEALQVLKQKHASRGKINLIWEL